MAIALAASTGAGTNGATMTMSYAGLGTIGATDLVLCTIVFRANNATTQNLTPPTGFTTLTPFTVASGTSFGMWVGYMFGPGGGTTASVPNTATYAYTLTRWTGVDQATPFDTTSVRGTQAAASTTRTVTAPAITTTTADAAVLSLYGARINDTTGTTGAWTPDAAITEVADFTANTAATSNVDSSLDYEIKAATGASTARVATHVLTGTTTSTNVLQGATIALRAAAVAALSLGARQAAKRR